MTWAGVLLLLVAFAIVGLGPEDLSNRRMILAAVVAFCGVVLVLASLD